MSKAKRLGKSNPKNQKQALLNQLAKQSNLLPTDRNSAKALLLETLLSGTNQELYELLKPWEVQQIENVVKSWVDSSVALLFNKLVIALEIGDNLWAYPWLKAVISRKTLSGEQAKKLKERLQQKQAQGTSKMNLQTVLRLQGKIELFNF